MNQFIKPVEIRWSDLDPNFHLRHSAYYDIGAYCRMAYLHEAGLTAQKMQELNIGPVIFREECAFKREVKFGDVITVNMQIASCTKGFTRWTMQHEIWKDATILCAVITLEGAWLNTEIRKLTLPPKFITDLMNVMPTTQHFISPD